MLIRFLASAAALAVATWLLPGIRLGGTDDVWGQVFTLLAVAAIFGFVNALIKPLFKFVSAPLILLTLGLFLLVLNAVLLMLVSWAAGELHLAWNVDGFWSAFWGGLIISIVTLIINASFGKKGTEHR
ncbi:MAG TPA: phage holin family protein [Propionicimonas sp.]|nr:phage holin family protein [Propionicimonas sp.]HRA05241.1 phage holin family protein [Propionicimonas sp.]